MPKTFLHGEFYASNILVQEANAKLRVRPVDWEMAGYGPGLVDLAALVSGNWTDEQKTEISLAYYEALPVDVHQTTAQQEFLTTLDYCQLHLAVQWLGWFGRRRPFHAHAQDWLGEVLKLIEKINL